MQRLKGRYTGMYVSTKIQIFKQLIMFVCHVC